MMRRLVHYFTQNCCRNSSAAPDNEFIISLFSRAIAPPEHPTNAVAAIATAATPQ
jgi:hypothetical protein